MFEGINIGTVAILATIVMALVEWIKKLCNDKLGYWSIAVAMALAFGVCYLASNGVIDVFTFVKESIMVGLTAGGFYQVSTNAAEKIVKKIT